MKKGKKSGGTATDKALASVASGVSKKIKTELPLAEKDEVKQAEDHIRKRLKNNRTNS